MLRLGCHENIDFTKTGEIHGSSQMVDKQLVVSTIDGGNDEEQKGHQLF